MAQGEYQVCSRCGDYHGTAQFCKSTLEFASWEEFGSWDPTDFRVKYFVGTMEGDEWTTPERHPLSERFHEILDELGDLHDKKQQDYGRDDDPFANVRATVDWGQPAWVGAMIRATDKVKRLQKYAQKGELANESVMDAFDDLAVYAIIARVLLEEELEEG